MSDQVIGKASSKPYIISSYKSYDLYILYKPSFILSHSDGRKIPDLITWSKSNRSLPDNLSLIHRLDLETSGIICASSTAEGLKLWGRVWSQQQVKKRYLALVHGKTRAKGKINRKLKDARRGKTLSAETRYRTLLHLENTSLLEITIIGGRKHQIRKHLQGIGHPVLGDQRYASQKIVKQHKSPRLCLHAIQLDIPMPDILQKNTKNTKHSSEQMIQAFCPLAEDLMQYLSSMCDDHLLQLQKVQNALTLKPLV